MRSYIIKQRNSNNLEGEVHHNNAWEIEKGRGGGAYPQLIWISLLCGPYFNINTILFEQLCTIILKLYTGLTQIFILPIRRNCVSFMTNIVIKKTL